MNARLSMGGGRMNVPQLDAPVSSNVGGMTHGGNPGGYLQFPRDMWSTLTNSSSTNIQSTPNSQVVSPTTIMLKCAHLPDGSQMCFERGDLIFTFNPRKEVPEEHVLMNIQTLNYYLQEAYIERYNKKENEEDITYTRRRGRLDLTDMPLTIDEFPKKVFYLGVLLSMDGTKEIRSRNMTIGIAGLVRDVTNVFGNMGVNDVAELRVGYASGLPRMHYDGRIIGDIVPGKFLQVLTYVNKQDNFPIIKTTSDYTDKEDACCLEPTLIEQKMIPQTAKLRSGLPDPDVFSRESDIPFLIIDVPKEMFVIRLGNIEDVRKHPPENDCKAATRSCKASLEIVKGYGQFNLIQNIRKRMLVSSISKDM
jgi:hypothetical protein